MIVERLLPEDVTIELAHLMDKKYAGFRGQRQFLITARRDFDRTSVQVVLRNADESYYYPVQGRLNFQDQDMKPEEAAFFLIDYIDLYYGEFFQEGEGLFIPIDWSSFNYDAVDFELKGQVLNRHVERKADQMLADSELLSDDSLENGYKN